MFWSSTFVVRRGLRAPSVPRRFCPGLRLTAFHSRKWSSSCFQLNANGFDFQNTVFNFLLPRGVELTLDDGSGNQAGSEPVAPSGETEEKASPLEGLGGFHGSVRTGATRIYYSVGVFSEGNNGIVAFNDSWKNVVATFYHELVEARTDADVEEGRVAWVNNEESVRPLSRAKPVWETGRAIPLSVLDTKAACSRWSSATPNWPKSSSCTRATAHATQKAAVRRHPRLLLEGDRLPRQPRQSDERSPAQRRFEYGTDPAHVVECNQRARGSDSGSALRRPFCCAKSGKHMTCWRARALLNARAAQRAAELPSRKECRHVQI